MTAIISNNTLGLMSSSLDPSRAMNVGGFGAPGNSGESMYVNVATGNLVVQRQDEMLKARGLDVESLLTYNSQGVLDGDNNDNWRIGFYRQIKSLTGTINNAGSTVIRVDDDGAERTYAYAVASNAYVSTDGDGSHDTLRYDISAARWTWTDGDSRITESYDWSNGIGKLLSRSDTAANTTAYFYNSTTGLLSQVMNASGESTFLDYTGLNLTRLRTVRNDGSTSTRVLYAYDGANRLTRVTVDLSPDDNSVADNKTYISNYTYDGASRRIATLTQSDGTSLSFTYDTSGRVSSITDALGRQCLYAYDSVNRITTVTDALGLQSTWRYDAKGQLLQVTSPNGAGGTSSRSYAYGSNGDLVQVTDELGRSTVMQYDANGNQTLQRDSLGNTVTRTFNGNNQLLSETTYLVPDPDGLDATHANALGAPGTPLTTRHVYDAAGKSQLRFIISPEGRVTEYRYNSNGQRIASIDYASTQYTATSALESDLSIWAASTAVDRTRSVRTDYAWDFRGQLSSSTVWGSVDSAGNGVAGTTTFWGTPVPSTGATTTYVYDARGLLLSTIAPLGGAAQTTSYVYDGLGRTVRVTNGLGQLTSTSYDDAGNKVVVTAANGLVTTSAFDAAGRLVSIQNMVQSSSIPSGPIYSTERYFYDKGDRLRMTEDATGVRTWLLYDDANRKVGEIDGNGSLTEFIYNAAGQLTRTIRYANTGSTTGLTVNADGSPSTSALALTLSALRPAANASQDQSTWNAYDSAGRLVETVDAAGGVIETRYDGASRVTSVIAYANRISTATLGDQPSAASIAPVANASADQVTRNFYDNDGLLQGTLDAEGYLVEILYDAAGRETQRIAYANATSSSLRAAGTLTQLRPATNANDISSWRFYDDRNQLVAEIDGERYLTEYLYDPNGNQQQSIRYANRVTATISAGATLATLRPAASAADQTSNWTYDALNRLASETDFEGTQTTYAYDSAGNLNQVVKAAGTSEARTSGATYNQAGQISAETNGRNKTTSYALDLAGRRISETDANGNRTLYYYDADDQLVYSINALGEVSANVYNTLHQRTAEIRYGSRLGASTLATMTGGLVTSSVQNTINSLANATLDSRTNYAYNLDGTLASSTDALNKTTSYQYDAFGNRTGVTTPIATASSLQQSYGYDRRNLQTSMREDPTVLNVTTSLQYDAFGRVISQTDARGKVSQQTYDKLGRVVQTRDRLNQTQSSTYDAFDRVLTQTDSLGSVTSYTYSAATRSVSIRTPEGITVTTARNRHGQTQTVTDGRGNVTTYVYDANGNLTQTTSPAGQITTQRYDDVDRLIETTDANNIKTAISYDAANRVLSRTVDPNATGYTGLKLVTSYAWDAKGQQIRVTDPLGVATEIVYDLNGQVTRRTVDSGAGRLNLDTLYSYDDRGKTLTVTDDAGGVTQYGYDKLGRRIEERVDPTGLNLITRYEYDANDNVAAKIDANNNRIRYAYDDEDRLRFEVDALGQVKETRYDTEGRVSRTIGYANPISLVGLGTAVSVADVTARLVSDLSRDSIESREYDRDGRLTYAVDGVGAVTKYDYDANGNVVQQTAYANQIAPGSAAYVPYVANTNSALWRDLGAFQLGDTVTATVYFKADSPITGRLYLGDGTSNAGVSIFSGIVTGNGAWQQLTVTLTLTRATNLRIYIYGNRDGTSHPASGDFVLYDQATVSSTGRGQVLDENFHSLAGWNDQAAGRTALAAVSSLVITAPASDQVSRNVYDAADRLVYAVDGTGAVTKYDYDANGNVVQKTAYANRIAAGALASSVVANASVDQVTRNVYDAADRLVYAVDGTGAVTKYDYDANGNVVQKTAYANRIAAGALASSVVANASVDQVTRNVYDAANRLVYAVDGTGAVTKYDYDANGNVVQQTAYANPVVSGKALRVPYVAGTNSAWWRDLGTFRAGDQVTLSVYFKSSGSSAAMLYLGNGGPGMTSSITAGNGNWQKLSITYTVPADMGLRAYLYCRSTGTSVAGDNVQYDNMTVTSMQRGMVTNEPFSVFGYDYDETGGNLQLVDVPALSVANAAGMIVADAVRDQVKRNVYDAANRLVYAVDGTGAVTKYDYDANGNVIQQTAYANTIYESRSLFYNFGSNLISNGTTATTATMTLPALSADSVVQKTELILRDVVANSFPYLWASFKNEIRVALSGAVTLSATPISTDASPGQITPNPYSIVVSNPSSNGGSVTLTLSETYNNVTVFGTELDDATFGNVQLKLSYALNNFTLASIAGWIQADPSRDRITRHTYDAAGRRIQTTLPTAGVYAAETDAALMANGAAGLASRMETSQSLSSQTYYDAWGNVIASRDIAGNMRYRAYDAIGQTRFDVDAEGYVTGYQYDAFGNVVSLTRYADKIADATRSAWGVQGASVATITSLLTSNTANRAITTLYDQASRAIEIREPSVLAYDGSTSGQAMPVTRHIYDAFGQRVQSQRQKLDGSWLNNYAYFDQAGREVATIDAGSYLTRRSYDAFGNVIEVVEYAGTASAPSMSGYGLPASQFEDRRLVFTYDSENRKISDTRVNVTYSVASDGSELTGNLTNLYAYDSFGNQVMMRDAGGYASYQYYDAANQLRAVTSSSRAIAGNANFTGLTELIRDAFGNVTDQIERANGASSANAIGYSNIASGNDRINSMVWNSRNQVVETVDADSKRQYFSYDAQGNVAKQWSSLAVSTGVERTLFKVSTYDRVGRVVSTVEPASSSGATSGLVRNQMRYNAFGEIVSKGIAGMDDGWSEYFRYDNSGRLVGTNSGDGVNKVMRYDLQGNLVMSFRGAANLAQGKVATQSSTVNGGTAGLAVDGNTNPIFAAGSITHTDWQSNPWWQVDLGTVQDISTIDLFNRGEGLEARLSNFYVFISDTDLTGRSYSSILADATVRRYWFDGAAPLSTSIAASTRGRYVRVQLSGDGQLSLAEVRVNGMADAASASGVAGAQRADYVYDALGRLTKEARTARQGPSGLQCPEIYRTYDRWGNLTSVNDPASGSAVTSSTSRMRYNANNQLLQETLPAFEGYRNDGVYGSVTPISNFYYDYAGNQLASRDARGNVNGSTYDSVGNVLTEIHADGGIIRHVYNAFDEEVQRTDALGNVTKYEYDRLGRMTRLIRPDADFYSIDNRVFDNTQTPVVGYAGLDQTGTSYQYWAGTYTFAQLGDSLKLTASVAVKPQYKASFDAYNAMSSYDCTTSQNLPEYVPVGGQRDDKIRMNVESLNVVSTNTANPVLLSNNRSSSIQTSYSQSGKQLSVINAAGQRLGYGYDLRGNITKVTQPDGSAITSEFDAQDRKVREVDANGNAATWTYNYFGRLMRRTDISGAVYGYTYDSVSGNLVAETSTPLAVTENRGRDISYTYDDAGQLVKMREKGQFSYKYFDGVEYWGDRVTTFEYDLAGRRTNELINLVDDSQPQRVLRMKNQSIWYDVSGRLKSVIHEIERPSQVTGMTLNYVYDAVGNRVRQDENSDGSIATSFFIYDAMNRQILVDGAYNNDLSDMNQYKPGKTVRIEYDKNGNRTAETRWNQSTNSFQRTEFTYDALGRLTTGGRGYDRADRLVTMDTEPEKREVRRYDDNGRLIAQAVLLNQNYGYGTQSLTVNTYDRVGNLSSSASYRTGYSDTTTYTYNRIGDGYRQTEISTNAPADSGKTTLKYDVNGYLYSMVRAGAQTAWLTNDAGGRILEKRSVLGSSMKLLQNVIVNGQMLGTFGDDIENNQWVSRRDFIAYQPIEKNFAGGGQNTYRVNAGDTLRSIASSVYGDAQMWYVIADANGIGEQSLQVGQILTLPPQVGSVHNNVNTFEPYNAARIIGDTSPVVSNSIAAQSNQCQQIKIIIAAVAVALVITVVTAGIGSVVGAALIGAGMGTAATIAATVTAGVLIGAAGGPLLLRLRRAY